MQIVKTAIFLKENFYLFLQKYIDLKDVEMEVLDDFMEEVVKNLANDFSYNRNKYFSLDDDIFINLYNSLHLFKLLYALSNQAYKQGFSLLSDKLYLVNKIVNGCDVYGGVKLPEIYHLDHPVGTVLGRAEYGNYFTFQQGCTVGGDRGLVYPKIGENVRLYANASIIGDCKIGNNVFIASNSHVKNEDVPDNCLVFGTSPNLIIKIKSSEYFRSKSVFDFS